MHLIHACKTTYFTSMAMLNSQVLNSIYFIVAITFCTCSLFHFHISTRNCLALSFLTLNRSFCHSDSCHILTLISALFFFLPGLSLPFVCDSNILFYFCCTYRYIYIFPFFCESLMPGPEQNTFTASSTRGPTIFFFSVAFLGFLLLATGCIVNKNVKCFFNVRHLTLGTI